MLNTQDVPFGGLKALINKENMKFGKIQKNSINSNCALFGHTIFVPIFIFFGSCQKSIACNDGLEV